MNRKLEAAVLPLSLLLLAVLVCPQTVGAQADSGVQYSSGVHLYSPLNTTYTSSTVPINLTFDMGIPSELNYTLDGVYSGDIPLTYVNGSEVLYLSDYTGIVELPQLEDGTHCLTITVDAELNDYHGANPPGEPFVATNPEGTNFSAVWVHTIYFTIDTATSAPTQSATPSPTPTSTIENIGENITPTAQPPTEKATKENQLPLMIVIIVAAFAAYIAVIAVMASKKIR